MWMLGLTLMALAGAAAGRESAEDVRGFTALLVPILFTLSALGVLIVGTFVELHPVAIVMASGCLVAAGVRTALTFEQTRELARTRVVAETDELSGLGNRRMLDSRLPAALQAIPPGSDVVLTIVSVDHLPEINRILGYPAGDAILQVVGMRLREYLPPGTVAVRLGGAEVAIVRTLHGSDVDGFLTETRALLSALSGPVLVGQMPVHIELSAGVAAAPSHAERADELIRCAADALRSCKTNRSNLEIYEPSLQNDFGSRLFPDLLRGINEDEFVAYYQPKFDLAAGRPTAIEAVLRWHHPTRGVIDAEAIHPLAAQVGLTRQLTLALLQNALQQCAAWRRQGVDLGVAADVTVADILDSRLPYDIAKMINKMGIPPSAVTLEIAEDVLLIDPRRTAVALGQFRHFGIRLSLDHYGRSAPSLTRLRSLRVDELKLDASFVRPILESAQDAAIVRSTIDMARSLRIVTVVDGVDSRELLDAVMACGCDLVQGAALGEPMSPEGVRNWLAGAVPAQQQRRPAGPPQGPPRAGAPTGPAPSYTGVGPQPATDRPFPQH
jgi:diguanylate cyclase (GGDEF)-like protein